MSNSLGSSPFQARLHRGYGFGGANAPALLHSSNADYYRHALLQPARSQSAHGYHISPQLSNSYSGWRRVNAWGDTSHSQSWTLPNELALQQYALALSHPVSGIPMQEGPNGLLVFSGDGAALWFTTNMEGVNNFEAAQDVGQRLMDLGVFTGLSGSTDFVISDMEFYTFAERYHHQVPQRPVSSPGIRTGIEATPWLYRSMLQERSGVVQSAEGSQLSLASLTSASELNSKQQMGKRGFGKALLSSESSPVGSSFSVCAAVSSKTSVSSGSSIDAVFEELGWSDYKSSPLHAAAGRGERSKVTQLVNQYGVNQRDSMGRTPLMYSVVTGQIKCCRALLKHEADINAVDRLGWSSLLLAVQHSQEDIVKVLLRHPFINPICCNQQGQNVFHLSCVSRKTKCLEQLLQHTPSLKVINNRNKENQTALHVAASLHHSEHLRLLLLSSAELSVSDDQGHTALHKSVAENALTCIQAILEIRPSDVNLVDLNGRSALHLACANGTIEAVSLLLASRYCDIDMRDSSMTSPLHLAVQNRRNDVVEVLLQRCANVMVNDAAKKTPLDYALEQNDTDCSRMLQGVSGYGKA
jgi:ankyrin repeat protein